MDTDVALDVKFPKGERPLRRSLTSCSRNLFDVSDIWLILERFVGGGKTGPSKGDGVAIDTRDWVAITPKQQSASRSDIVMQGLKIQSEDPKFGGSKRLYIAHQVHSTGTEKGI